MINEAIGNLGKQGRDKVTRLEGVISSVSFDLYGCVQYALTPVAKNDGELPNGRWFDIHRVYILSDEKVMQPPDFQELAPTVGDFNHGPADKPLPS